jgi:N-acetylglucosamine-6-phosphate deacetylase
MPVALINGRVLLDDGFADDVAVLVDGERIAAIVARDDTRVRDADHVDLHGGTLAPGFIDCQVNGGGGVLFNDSPTVDAIQAIAQAHRRFGTTGLLPTLISDNAEITLAAVGAAGQALEQRVPGALGLHLEGPFLAPQRKGIHDAKHFRTPDAADIAMFAQLRSGTLLLTVAPEQVGPDAIRRIAGLHIVVAAGHTAATYEETRAALDAGLRGFTHLYNAMSPLTGRAPGVVGAALEDRRSWCGIIVDGHHVHPGAARVALTAKPRGKIFLVTDAMPPVGAASETFVLNGETITCRDGKCTNAHGVLAGSALDMASAVRNTVELLQVPLDEALRMAAAYPADFLGLSDRGRIAPGAHADLVLLDDALQVCATWIRGEIQRH